MLWKRIKDILQKEGGKCIIVEEDGPAYLITRLKEDDSPLEMEKINRDIAEWKEDEKNNAEDEELKVEGIPF